MQAPTTVDVDQTSRHPVRRVMLLVSRAISYVVYAYVIIVEIILFLGFLLLLLGANPSSSFVEWVYRSMDRAMRPFRGIFEPVELGTTQADVPSVLDTSVLFAMIVYAILAIVVHALLEWLTARLARLDREDEEYRRRQLVEQSLAATAQYPPTYPAQYPPTHPPTAAPTGIQPTVAPPPQAPPVIDPAAGDPPSAAPPGPAS